MTSFLTKTGIAAGLLGLALSAGAAMAQAPAQAPAAAPKAQPKAPAAAPAAAAPTGIKVALKGAPEQKEWLKICGEDPAIKKTLCYSTRDFVAENNQPVMAVAIYEIKEDSRRFVRFLVPLTFMIQPGIRFGVEGTPAVTAKFQICLPQGCFVEGDVNDATIAAMKKGGILRVDMQNQVGQEVNFQIPLDTFGKVYDSKGMTQEELAKLQQPQQGAAPAATGDSDELKKKAEEMMKQRQQNAPKQ